VTVANTEAHRKAREQSQSTRKALFIYFFCFSHSKHVEWHVFCSVSWIAICLDINLYKTPGIAKKKSLSIFNFDSR